MTRVARILDLDSDGALTALDGAGWVVALSAMGLVVLLAGTGIFALLILGLKGVVRLAHATGDAATWAVDRAADVVVDALHRAAMSGGGTPRPRH